MKIAFGDMREMGLRGVLVYRRCGHSVALSADRWPDDVRLSDIETRFVCAACGNQRGSGQTGFQQRQAASVCEIEWPLATPEIQASPASVTAIPRGLTPSSQSKSVHRIRT
ncbi:hypothetical protein [Bradyrhizobium sp. BWC-3-1]|uniref:hypothetical protein n=1 Tax=Bradyrhizobium sp. BWC-3-1 TaxID=3080012 RepID=UPI00293F521C|nr:hypothetical protein [Bradyrhizobium sp. BWC-3-1]WOH55159.1 hypothetical protein RX329_22845 [Bradyrhizobium sp. BWC-3-1]